MSSTMKITDDLSIQLTQADLMTLDKSIDVYKMEIGEEYLKEGMTWKVLLSLQWITKAEEEYKDLRLKLLARNCLVVPMTSVMGGSIGGSLGYYAAYQLGISTLGPFGLIGGVALGFGIGLIGTTQITRLEFQERFLFVQDKEKEKVEKIETVFSEFLESDDILKDCLCPISGEVMVTPVKAPDKHVYECLNIVEWIYNKPSGSVASPLRICDFSVEDLDLDFDMLEKIGSRVQHLYYAHIKNLQNNNVIKYNFTSFAQKRNNAYKLMFDSQSHLLLSMRLKKKIDQEKYAEEHEKVFNLYEKIKIIEL